MSKDGKWCQELNKYVQTQFMTKRENAYHPEDAHFLTAKISAENHQLEILKTACKREEQKPSNWCSQVLSKAVSSSFTYCLDNTKDSSCKLIIKDFRETLSKCKTESDKTYKSNIVGIGF